MNKKTLSRAFGGILLATALSGCVTATDMVEKYGTNGAITREQFGAGLEIEKEEHQRAMLGMNADRIFGMYDKDGNGSVTIEEIEEVQAERMEEMEEQGMYNSNGGGYDNGPSPSRDHGMDAGRIM